MSTAQYSQFRNEGDDKMYCPPNAPPGYAPQGAPPVSYAPPMGQSCAPPPPVNILMSAPQTQTIISTTQTMPNDHFGLALFVCLCCFWPLGIVALIKANEVRSRFNVGDILGANQSSEDARKYSMIALGIGISSVVISIIIVIVVRNRFNVGDVLGANQSSEEARKYSMIGLGIGIASIVISIVFVIVYVAVIVGATAKEGNIFDNIDTNVDFGSTSILG